MSKKIFDVSAGLIFAGTLIYFVMRPTLEVTWTDVMVAFLSALAACVWIGARAARVSNWRTLGVLLIVHLLAQVWLQWQWQLWDTQFHNVNALALLLVFDSLATILFVSALLLIRRDASIVALAVVWFGCPLGLLLSMSRYATAAQVEGMPLRDWSIALAVICLLGFLAVAGLLAFSAHFLRLLYLELAGKT